MAFSCKNLASNLTQSNAMADFCGFCNARLMQENDKIDHARIPRRPLSHCFILRN